jgi:hypothetical protein
MELRSRGVSRGMVWRALFVCLGLGMFGSLRFRSQLVAEQRAQITSSATAKLFPCIQSRVQTNKKNRVAILHGPDWVIESSIEPSCLPERDVVFVSKVGEGLISHPFTARTRLWVIKNHDVTHVRIVESSAGSAEREMVAVSFVTNHKCIDKGSKNCSIKGGEVFVRID